LTLFLPKKRLATSTLTPTYRPKLARPHCHVLCCQLLSLYKKHIGHASLYTYKTTQMVPPRLLNNLKHIFLILYPYISKKLSNFAYAFPLVE